VCRYDKGRQLTESSRMAAAQVFTGADAILPKMFIRDAHHRE
jgi:hypothetical protein